MSDSILIPEEKCPKCRWYTFFFYAVDMSLGVRECTMCGYKKVKQKGSE